MSDDIRIGVSLPPAIEVRARAPACPAPPRSARCELSPSAQGDVVGEIEVFVRAVRWAPGTAAFRAGAGALLHCAWWGEPGRGRGRRGRAARGGGRDELEGTLFWPAEASETDEEKNNNRKFNYSIAKNC